jgi:hydroxypyruvate isomerase
MSEPINRRDILTVTAGAMAAGTLGGNLLAEDQAKVPAEGKKLKHSIVQWCFKDHWNIEELCGVANNLGCKSVEVVPVAEWPTLKKHGLICALAVAHGFDKGMNNPKYQEMCLDKLHKAIDDCAEAGYPNVITFTGFREDIPDDVGLKNCVAGFKKIVGYAEKKNVTLVLEMLNSRVDVHMKGHPGYQGDHTDYCMEIVKQVASPRFKLLFDVYHVQIMDGDIIMRIHQYADWIGHVHTAGNPGRREIDDKQEIYYPPIMKALADVGYTGYVGHEFIPTRDPLAGLKEAIAACDY